MRAGTDPGPRRASVERRGFGRCGLARSVQIVTYIKHRAPRRAEVYVESRAVDGLMIFRGYYQDLALRSPRVCERVHPLVAAHLAVVQDYEASRIFYDTIDHQ